MKSTILKAEGALIRHQGTLADLSTKICISMGELSDDQVVNLNKLVKNQAVDVVIVESGKLSEIMKIINESLAIIDSDAEKDKSQQNTMIYGTFDDE